MVFTVEKFRRFAIILTWNLGILAVGILVIESFFGNWWGQNPIIRLRIPQNISVVKDISEVYPDKKRVVLYVRDRYGFRGKYPNPKLMDLLTIGGSTTAQENVGEGETWQDILSAEFAKDGKRIYIANAGVDGHTTYSHIRSFKLWFPHVPDLKPRYIMAYVGMNDVYLFPGLYRDQLLESFSWIGYVKRKSAFYLLYRYFRTWLVHWSDITSRRRFEKYSQVYFEWTGPIQLAKEDEKKVEANKKSYEEKLRMLVKKIKEWGAIPILVTQKEETYKMVNGKIQGFRYVEPGGGVQFNDLTDQMMMTLNEVTMRVCKEMRGICIDLAKELDFEKADFYDSTHTTPSGSRKIGHYLYEKLKPHLVLGAIKD